MSFLADCYMFVVCEFILLMLSLGELFGRSQCFSLGGFLVDQCCWVSFLFGGMNVFCLGEVFN